MRKEIEGAELIQKRRQEKKRKLEEEIRKKEQEIKEIIAPRSVERLHDKLKADRDAPKSTDEENKKRFEKQKLQQEEEFKQLDEIQRNKRSQTFRLEQERAFIIASLKQLEEEEKYEKQRRLQADKELEKYDEEIIPSINHTNEDDDLNALLAKLITS